MGEREGGREQNGGRGPEGAAQEPAPADPTHALRLAAVRRRRLRQRDESNPSATSATPAPAQATRAETAEAHVPETADELIVDSDTSHNRHGGEEAVSEDLKDALFDSLCLALEKAGVEHAVVAGLAGKVLGFARRGKWSEVRRALSEQLTNPTTVVDVLKFLGKKLAEPALVGLAEHLDLAAAAIDIATVHAKLGLAVIEKAHREGDHEAQLHQYAWAWANEFMRDDYQPSFFAALDEQMEIMNTCLRLGVQDANSSRGSMEYEMYLLVRDHMEHHYGNEKAAIQAIHNALMKQAGVK